MTRECNQFYEQGEQGELRSVESNRSEKLSFSEIKEDLRNRIFKKDITSLTIKSFDQAFRQLEDCLPPRLEHIQTCCQSIEELEMERVQKVTRCDFHRPKRRVSMNFRFEISFNSTRIHCTRRITSPKKKRPSDWKNKRM